MLDLNLKDLVSRIQSDALPELVLRGRKEVIQKMAGLQGEADAWRLIMDSNNLARVVPFLMARSAHYPADLKTVEASTIACLVQISPRFSQSSLSDLIKVDIVRMVLEFLKMARAEDGRSEEHSYRKVRLSGI